MASHRSITDMASHRSITDMASQRRRCLNDPDHFCFICGSYTLLKQQRNITDMVKKLYFSYFKLKLGDQDKKWAPHIVCETCLTY